MDTIRLFLKAIWEDWLSLMSGICGLAFWLVGAVWDNPSARWWFWTLGGVALLIASYLVWRRKHEEVEQTKRLLEDSKKPKMELLEQVDHGEWKEHYRVIVACRSGGAVTRCGVDWIWSDPPLDQCPIPLHCSGLDRPLSGNADMNPGQSRKFDVARVNPKTGNLEVSGAHPGHVFPIGKKQYRIRLRAHASNSKYMDREFILDGTGKQIVFYPVLGSQPSQLLDS